MIGILIRKGDTYRHRFTRGRGSEGREAERRGGEVKPAEMKLRRGGEEEMGDDVNRAIHLQAGTWK